eukprot:3568762-Pleurochrysis_carterae.AAC.2
MHIQEPTTTCISVLPTVAYITEASSSAAKRLTSLPYLYHHHHQGRHHAVACVSSARSGGGATATAPGRLLQFLLEGRGVRVHVDVGGACWTFSAALRGRSLASRTETLVAICERSLIERSGQQRSICGTCTRDRQTAGHRRLVRLYP